jgi:hypothetical protein
MTMTPEEICRAYRLAKNKANELTVLADLNQCGRKEILAILEAGGDKIDGRLYGRRKPKEENPMNEKTTAPAPVPKKTGVTLTNAEVSLLIDFLEAALCQHVIDQLASSEPRKCLLQLHRLTGIYKRLTEAEA